MAKPSWALAFATAGRVDVNTGNIALRMKSCPDGRVSPRDALRERFECPSAVLGDVQSHALGEARWGAARGAQTGCHGSRHGPWGGIICHGKKSFAANMVSRVKSGRR